MSGKRLSGLALAGILGCLLLEQVALAQAYPVKKSANGRYLVDQNNVPFLIAGDAPQSLMVNISEADADMYFANRQSHGFNAAWINLLCNTGTAGRSDGSTYDGIVPFTTPNDLSTPNDAYFTRCDHMINLAANHGILVFLDPAETIGFLSVLRSNGTTKCRAYGQYLGNRYKNFNNIVWMSGNDYQTWSDPANDAVVTAVALGIKDTDTRHIQTVELNYLVSGSLDDPNWAPIISLNATYTYYPTYAQVLTDYNRANFLPVFLVEANYEFESLRGYLTTAYICRKQEYWTNLSGATGQLYGSGYTWTFKSGWRTTLDSPGAVQMAYVKALFEPRAWYNLVPDQNHTVVTAGYGTFSSGGSVDTNDYATAARAPDGSLVMAYMPTHRTFTVDMTKLSGPANARWYDPSSGATLTITGSPFANTGSRTFTPPNTNSAGDPDWVLVLEAGPGPANRPPTIPTGASATPNPALVGQTVSFSVAATDPDGDPLSYSWAFGDGATGSGASTSHSYSAAGTYSATVTVSDGRGGAATSSVSVTVNPSGGGTLPSPWQDADIGAVGPAGSASYAAGVFDVCGAGADIWGTADAFHFAYQPLPGDGEIIARVTGLGNTNPWAKAGVMIRETLNPNSVFADVVVTPANGTAFQRRTTTGGAAVTTAGPTVTVPYWVRLARAGNTFTGSVSPDGVTWTVIGTDTIAMAANAYIGLAVTAHDATVVNCSTMDSVSGSGGWAPPAGGGGATPAGASGGKHRRCGATGLEALLVLGLISVSIKRKP